MIFSEDEKLVSNRLLSCLDNVAKCNRGEIIAGMSMLRGLGGEDCEGNWMGWLGY